MRIAPFNITLKFTALALLLLQKLYSIALLTEMPAHSAAAEVNKLHKRETITL